MKFQYWNALPARQTDCCVLEKAGIPPLVARVLCARGMDTLEKAEVFLGAGTERLEDPLLIQDMHLAASRIEAALAEGETMAVYGDYDVDGITSTCLLTHYLRRRGGQVLSYIPDRIEEGYGLNCDAVSALKEQGVSLIITVDCGITAGKETAFAQELGVDVVITDHHACKFPLPDAVAVVNPHRPDCPYPFKHLAGVGVALKLVLALEGKNAHAALLSDYAELAAIGTIADVMVLTGENRAIVSMGLAALQNTTRPGVRALLREAGLDGKPISAMAVGYGLAPRINAAGRMGCTEIAAELLLTEHTVRAQELAQKLCGLNRERQAIEAAIFEECVARIEKEDRKDSCVLVMAQAGWHQGVIGIVASRLSERYQCPAFVISLQDGKGKGSCRSFGGVNLFSALEACADLLEVFGGHALAAGFTVQEKNLSAFAARINEYIAACEGQTGTEGTLEIDGEIEDASLLSLAGVEALNQLEPCGAGNPQPVFALLDCTVDSMSEVGGGRHLKLKVTSGGKSFDAIFFATTYAQAKLLVGERIDVAFTPQMNQYRNWCAVQLHVCDLRSSKARVQAEQALYERFRRGEQLSAVEAQMILPSREEFVTLWRYLKGQGAQGKIEEEAQRLTRNLSCACGRRETFARTMVCLEVFYEQGLIELERSTEALQINLNQVEGKVDLEQSSILWKLRHFMEA